MKQRSQRSLLLTLTLCAGLIATTAANTIDGANAAAAEAAQKPASYADAAKAADMVKELDAKRFTAQTKNDFDALASLLADDLVYTHSSAAVDGKTTLAESMRNDIGLVSWQQGKASYVVVGPSADPNLERIAEAVSTSI